MNGKVKEMILTSINFLLVLLWTYAALSKLFDFKHSRGQMLNQVFSSDVANILAWAVPAIELATAALFLFTKTKLTGLYISALLLFGFTGYIALVLGNVFGRIPCSCGGVLEKLSWGQHLIFNFLFLSLALLGVFYELKERRQMRKVNA